jgi:hypothetical protein
MDHFLKVLNDDPKEYTIAINDKKTGLLCEQRTYINGYPMVRITMKYNYPALWMFRALVNCVLHCKYDANCDA